MRSLPRIAILAASVGLATVVMTPVARGQEGPPRDVESSDDRPRPLEGRGPRDGLPPDREGRYERFERYRYRTVPDPEEWQSTVEFMNEHAPNMARKIQETDRLSTPAQERVKAMAFERYREIRQLRENPELHDIRLKMLRVRDALFGYLTELRDAEEEQAAAIREKAREQVKELIGLTFQERELRLKDLEKRLEKERQSLERDRGRLDALVEERLDRELNPGRRDDGSASDGASGDSTEQEMRQRRMRELQRIHPESDQTTQPATDPIVE